MSKKDTGEDVSLADRVAALEKGMSDMSAWRRKVSTNWKKFVGRFVGPAELKKDSDGELGFALIGVMVALLVTVIGATVAVAVPQVAGDIENWGPAAIRQDGSFESQGGTNRFATAIITNLTVGTLSAGVTMNATTVTVLTVTQNATVNTNLTVGGIVQLNGTRTQITNDLNIGKNVTVTGTVTVTGAAAFNGGITADSTKFTVADTTGNTYIDGTLIVSGAVTGSNTVAATGYKIGSISGYSAVVTNCAGLTNIISISGGLITNVVTIGIAP